MTYQRCLTIKVQHAIVVFVSVLQQLIDLVLCDRLPSAADDLGELISVNVAVCVPVRKITRMNQIRFWKILFYCKVHPVALQYILVKHTEAFCQLFLTLASLVLL